MFPGLEEKHYKSFFPQTKIKVQARFLTVDQLPKTKPAAET